jgi:hypothetical protein
MKTIHHVVDMDAPAARVWEALTDLTALAGWWSAKVEEEGGSGVGGRARLRFWQEYAIELADDYYGVYNFNWGYYLESLRLLCVTGTGKPFQAGSGQYPGS